MLFLKETLVTLKFLFYIKALMLRRAVIKHTALPFIAVFYLKILSLKAKRINMCQLGTF